MATQETQQLDEIIATTRRRMLTVGGAALAGLALNSIASAQTTTLTDNDVLNFALNLEFLEGNFYTLAASGQTVNQAGIPITGVGTQGTVVTKAGGPAACLVPFAHPTVQKIAIETALDEQNHIKVLQGALGSLAVAQPQIDLYNSFNTLWTSVLAFFSATANQPYFTANGVTPPTGLPTTFDPFYNDITFLLGAYIFEVGVSAYTGAATLLTVPANLSTAAGLQAIEGYHYGAIRTSLSAQDQNASTFGPTSAASPAGTASILTVGISAVRAMLDGTMTTAAPLGADVPDSGQYVYLNGAASTTDPSGNVSINGTATSIVHASSIVNCSTTAVAVTQTTTGNTATAAPPSGSTSGSLALSRTAAQVLKIAYGGVSTGGGFFPAKLNGNIA